MSLETVIKENTEALRSLIVALASTNIGIPPVPAPPPPSPQTEAEQQPQPEEEPLPPPAALDYSHVKTAIIEISKVKGRDVAREILARHGVTLGPQLRPDQYEQVIAEIRSSLSEGAVH